MKSENVANMPAARVPGADEPQMVLLHDPDPGVNGSPGDDFYEACGWSMALAVPKGVDESWLRMFGAVLVGDMWKPARPMVWCQCGGILTYKLVNLVDVEFEVDPDEPDVEFEAQQAELAR